MTSSEIDETGVLPRTIEQIWHCKIDRDGIDFPKESEIEGSQNAQSDPGKKLYDTGDITQEGKKSDPHKAMVQQDEMFCPNPRCRQFACRTHSEFSVIVEVASLDRGTMTC